MDPIVEANRTQYIRALERALKILGADPTRIAVTRDGEICRETVLYLRGVASPARFDSITELASRAP